jgi:hypothetical protein
MDFNPFARCFKDSTSSSVIFSKGLSPMLKASLNKLGSPGGIAAVTLGCDNVKRNASAANSGSSTGLYQQFG